MTHPGAQRQHAGRVCNAGLKIFGSLISCLRRGVINLNLLKISQHPAGERERAPRSATVHQPNTAETTAHARMDAVSVSIIDDWQRARACVWRGPIFHDRVFLLLCAVPAPSLSKEPTANDDRRLGGALAAASISIDRAFTVPSRAFHAVISFVHRAASRLS